MWVFHSVSRRWLDDQGPRNIKTFTVFMPNRTPEKVYTTHGDLVLSAGIRCRGVHQCIQVGESICISASSIDKRFLCDFLLLGLVLQYSGDHSASLSTSLALFLSRSPQPLWHSPSRSHLPDTNYSWSQGGGAMTSSTIMLAQAARIQHPQS